MHCRGFSIVLEAHTHANQPHAGHLICGEGASLVRADNGGAAQGLNRGQLPEQRMPGQQPGQR